MQVVEKGNKFIFVFPYNPRLVSAVKSLPGATFDVQNKWWWMYNVNGNRQKIEQFARQYGFAMNMPTSEQPFDRPLPEMPELGITDEQLSKCLKLKPYPYQLQGIAYCLQHKRVIIGDQPGLGKTAQAIAAITVAKQFPCLVICPSSLKVNWQREWHMWTYQKAVILNDSNKNTWHMLAKGQSLFGQGEAGMAQVFITNYESLKKFFVTRIETPKDRGLSLKDVRFSPNINLFKSVIIDESHRVKEVKTQQTKFTKGICTDKEWVFALTGTPVVNKPADLVSQLSIIGQFGRFGGYKYFLGRYCGGFDKGHSNLKELNWMLHTHCFFRREKKDVLKELPDKVRQVVYCDILNRREYNDALADLEMYLKKYRQATDKEVARSMKGEVMVRIGVLKNVSARGKLNDVVEYISDVVEAGEKIVVFIHLKEVRDHLKKMFPAAVTITGEDSMADRQRAVDSFQKDPDCQVIICSIKAAGVGLTLTASSRVAFVELPWHPADTEQAEDRCHRISQKNSVQCTYFLGRDTIDEWVYRIIDEKRGISDQITGARNEVEVSVMDSVINLFNQKAR
jgi:SWI/SNF-related matrix-associated actin-dependent regulator of chromatin subfamily A-like protein 1